MATQLLRTLPAHIDAGLLFLRVSGATLLFYVHGLPKIMHYADELGRIEDPFGLGSAFSLWFALLAEIVCPLLIALGILVRLACVPIIVVLLVALFVVHPDWSLAEGQFGWLLLITFITLLLTGPGHWSLSEVVRAGRILPANPWVRK